MRVILFLCMLGLCSIVNAQLQKNLVSSSDKKENNVRIVIRCGSSYINNPPLFILDGVIIDESEIQGLDPKIIDSVYVLKNSAATALFGLRAMNGVIIIKTKISKIRKFEIRSSADQHAISKVYIRFVSIGAGTDTISLQTDSRGFVETDKLKSGQQYHVSIDHPGYQSFSIDYENRYDQFTHFFVLKQDVSTPQSAIDFFPNPIQKGRSLSISIQSTVPKTCRLVIVNTTGQILSSSLYNIMPGKNLFNQPINSSWSAGCYFLQHIENGIVVKKEKLIIQ